MLEGLGNGGWGLFQLAAASLQRHVTCGPFAGFSASEAPANLRVKILPSIRVPLDRGHPESTRHPVHLLPAPFESEQRHAITG